LPATSNFLAGAREIAQVTFNVLVVTNSTTTAITFADQPVLRQASDAAGHVLPAMFVPANISIAAVQFEGDVSPRPNGNQAVTVTDWVLIGLYAAGLEQPTNASEFQRADCAPRSSLGNGHISVTDWVQAGRYVAGLDPLTPAGGPTGPLVSIAPLLQAAGNPKSPSVRQIILSDASLTAGQACTVLVSLHGDGNEKALGFSVVFDPGALSFVNASLDAAISGATLNVNSAEAAAGHLGFLLGLPGTRNFAAGDNQLVQISFRAAASASGNYSLGFADGPVSRETSDAGANALPTDYLAGSVSVEPLPALRILLSGQNVTLTWPSSATGFVLQAADDGILSSASWTNVDIAPNTGNDESSVTVPVNGAAKFYRLHRP
jgi:hypothetical protein